MQIRKLAIAKVAKAGLFIRATASRPSSLATLTGSPLPLGGLLGSVKQ